MPNRAMQIAAVTPSKVPRRTRTKNGNAPPMVTRAPNSATGLRLNRSDSSAKIGMMISVKAEPTSTALRTV